MEDLNKVLITEESGQIPDLEGQNFNNNQFAYQTGIIESSLAVGEYIYDDCIKIIEFISEGGQAKLYLGLIEEIGKYVAIKRYYINSNENESNKISLECEIVKMLEHPNIIKYYDIDVNQVEEGNSLVQIKMDIIMEFMEGMNLREFITKKYPKGLSIDLVKYITRKILDGLVYLHSNKIIHRDLKPENILVNNDLSEIKIVDFGICTQVKDSDTIRKRTVVGTPYYMAPEVTSEKPYAFEADIWSLGCIAYELFCGLRPYGDLNSYNVTLNIIQFKSPLQCAHDDIKDIFYARSNRDLLDFLDKCWNPHHKFRPSAKDLLEDKFFKA